MRQWLGVPVSILCDLHRKGEYREHFTVLSNLKRFWNFDGYFVTNCLELDPTVLQKRFDQLRAAMVEHGCSVKPSIVFDAELFQYLGHARFQKIDTKQSMILLMSRCAFCRDNALQQGVITEGDYYYFTLDPPDVVRGTIVHKEPMC